MPNMETVRDETNWEDVSTTSTPKSDGNPSPPTKPLKRKRSHSRSREELAENSTNFSDSETPGAGASTDVINSTTPKGKFRNRDRCSGKPIKKVRQHTYRRGYPSPPTSDSDGDDEASDSEKENIEETSPCGLLPSSQTPRQSRSRVRVGDSIIRSKRIAVARKLLFGDDDNNFGKQWRRHGHDEEGHGERQDAGRLGQDEWRFGQERGHLGQGGEHLGREGELLGQDRGQLGQQEPRLLDQEQRDREQLNEQEIANNQNDDDDLAVADLAMHFGVAMEISDDENGQQLSETESDLDSGISFHDEFGFRSSGNERDVEIAL